MKKFDHYFSNHIAVKTELDTITIVDYYDPKKGYEYNLRYIFDRRNSSLAITGDFGELVARNFYNMGEWDTFYNHYTGDLGLILDMLNPNINKPKYLHLTESEIKQDFEWAWQFAKEVTE